MHFGKQILDRRHEPWAQYYIDYAGLKTILEDCSDGDGNSEQTPNNNALPLLVSQSSVLSISSSLRQSRSGATTISFQSEFDRQVRKVVLFQLQKQGSIASQLTEAEIMVIAGTTENNSQKQKQQYLNKIATELYYLIEFVGIWRTGCPDTNSSNCMGARHVY